MQLCSISVSQTLYLLQKYIYLFTSFATKNISYAGRITHQPSKMYEAFLNSGDYLPFGALLLNLLVSKELKNIFYFFALEFLSQHLDCHNLFHFWHFI